MCIRDRAGDVGVAGEHAPAQVGAEIAAQFVGVARQREQRRMAGIGIQRQELVLGAAAEAHGEQAVRRDLDMAQGIDEGLRVAFELPVRGSGEPQQGAAAAGDRGERAMPGMAMERMALRADDETVERGLSLIHI